MQHGENNTELGLSVGAYPRVRPRLNMVRTGCFGRTLGYATTDRGDNVYIYNDGNVLLDGNNK